MNRLLIIALATTAYFSIVANEQKEFSCEPREIQNFLVELHRSAEKQKASLRTKNFKERKIMIDAIENQKKDTAREFIQSAAFYCIHSLPTIESLASQIKNPNNNYCNFNLLIDPILARINQDNTCDLAALKLIAVQLPNCPQGKQALNVIKEHISKPACQKEFAQFINTIQQ